MHILTNGLCIHLYNKVHIEEPLRASKERHVLFFLLGVVHAFCGLTSSW